MMVTLSRPASAERSQQRAQHHAGIILHRMRRRTRLHHALRQTRKHGNVDAHARGRDHAEVGKRRITPADAGQAEEDAPESVAARPPAASSIPDR